MGYIIMWAEKLEILELEILDDLKKLIDEK